MGQIKTVNQMFFLPALCHHQARQLTVLCLQRHGEDPDPEGLLSLRLPLHPGRPDLLGGEARGRQGDLHQQGAVLRRHPGVPPRPRPGPQVRHSQVRHHACVQVLWVYSIEC